MLALITEDSRPDACNEHNEALIDDFLSLFRSPGTKRVYAIELNKFEAWARKPLEAVSARDALNYSKYISASIKNEKTLQRIFSILRSFYSFLIDLDALGGHKNPFKILKPICPRNTTNERILTLEELEALKTVASQSGARDYAIIALLVTAGLRAEELLSLNWSDLTVSADGHYFAHVTRKGGERKAVHIDKAWPALRALKSASAAGGHIAPDAPLFISEKNNRSASTRLTGSGLRKLIHTLCKRAGIGDKDVSPHWLRHSFITHSLAGGASLRDVQDAANHKSIRTTEIYLHSLGTGVDKFLPIDF